MTTEVFPRADPMIADRLAAQARTVASVISERSTLGARIDLAYASAAHAYPPSGESAVRTRFEVRVRVARELVTGWDMTRARAAVVAAESSAQDLLDADTRRQAESGATQHRLANEATAPKQVVRWTTYIANTGTQRAVDACTGGLTRWSDDLQGRPYLPIHRACGGAPILNLHKGDLVKITGGDLDGVWRVVAAKDVPKYGAGYDAAASVAGSAILQTCYRGDELSRLVGIVRD